MMRKTFFHGSDLRYRGTAFECRGDTMRVMGKSWVWGMVISCALLSVMQTRLTAETVSSLERDDFTIAMRAFEDGMYEFSRQQLEHFLSTWPESQSRPLAHFFLAEISFQKKEYGRAAREFSAFIQRYGKHQRVEEAMFKLGRCKFLSGDFAGAGAAYTNVTKSFPSSDMLGTAYYWIGESHFRKKKFAEAAEAFSASLIHRKTNQQVEHAMFRRGSCYLELGDFAAAEADFSEVYRTSTDAAMRTEASQLELRMMFERKDYQSFLKAIGDTSRVIGSEAKDEITLLTATAWLRSGQARECLSYLDTVFGAMAAQKQKPANLAELYFIQAAAHLSLEQYEGAIDTFTRIVSEFPKHAKAEEALITAAYIHLKLGQVQEAENLYQRSLTSFPKGKMRQETYKGLGSLELQRQNYDAAIKYFSSALQLADTATKPLILLAIGDSQRQAKNYHEARQTYQSIVSEYPNVAEVTDNAAFQMALCDFHLQRYEQTIRQLNAFVLSYPDSGLLQRAKYWLGETYLKMGNEDLATVAFQEFLRSTPDAVTSKSVIEKLAYGLYRRERYGDALIWFSQLRELLSPPPPELLLTMAHSYEQTGQEAEARKVYREYIERYPEDERALQVRLSLAQRLMLDAQLDDALEMLQPIVPDAITDGPRRWNYDMLQGDIMIRQGRGKGALAWFRATQRRTADPELNARTRLAIGRLFLAEGMIQDGYNEYIAIVKADVPAEIAREAMQAMHDHAVAAGDTESARIILDLARNHAQPELVVAALYYEASDNIGTGDLIAAFELLSRIIEQHEGREPWFCRALMKAGLIREEQADRAAATEYYRRLITANPPEHLRLKAIQRLELLDSPTASDTDDSERQDIDELLEENLSNIPPLDVSEPHGKDEETQ